MIYIHHHIVHCPAGLFSRSANTLRIRQVGLGITRPFVTLRHVAEESHKHLENNTREPYLSRPQTGIDLGLWTCAWRGA